MMMPLVLSLCTCIISQAYVYSFTPKYIINTRKSSTSLFQAGKGFGRKSSGKPIKVRQTYGKAQRPKDELIDTEGAMEEFFRTKEEWHPLFASLATSDKVPAIDFLPGINNVGGELSFEDTDKPWRELPNVPSGDNKDELLATIAKVLDASQQALVDIPVNEATKEDSDDLHFLEEGRRILCLKRFQVLSNEDFASFDSAIERHETIFQTVWSEIMYLIKSGEEDSGSLIILPDMYDITDLKRFTDMNILRPLDWLGIDSSVLEVASLKRESPCIRLLHKLSDIPSLEARDSQLDNEQEL